MIKKIFFVAILIFVCINIFAQQTRVTFGFSYKEKVKEDKYITVLEVMPGGEAEKAGMKSGNEILSINGNLLESKTNEEVTEMIVKAKAANKMRVGITGLAKNISLSPSTLSQYRYIQEPDKNGFAKALECFDLYIYEGEIANGTYNGKGKRYFIGKSKSYKAEMIIQQIGTFKDGKFVSGSTCYFNGDTFTGTVKNGYLRNGVGTYTANGYEYFGKFNDAGYWDGTIQVRSPDGTITMREFKDGREVKNKTEVIAKAFIPEPKIDVKSYNKKLFREQLTKILNNQGNQFEDIKGAFLKDDVGVRHRSTVNLEGFDSAQIIDFADVSYLHRYEAKSFSITGKTNALAFFNVLDKEIQALVKKQNIERIIVNDMDVSKQINFIFKSGTIYNAREIKFLRLDINSYNESKNPEEISFTITIRIDKPSKKYTR